MPHKPYYRVIGLVGYPGSGKDTLADIVAKRLGVARYSFAAPLKRIYASANGFTQAQVEQFKTGHRRGLQYIGNAIRAEDPDFFVSLAGRQYWDNKWYKTGVIISDVRYDNEFEFCDEVIAIQRNGVGPVNEDISENNTGRLMKKCRNTIYNNCTPESGADSLEACMHEMGR